MLAYLNGEYLPLEDAKLHVSDLAIQRGYGIFDFFRVSEGVPLYLEDYLNRFYRSAETMGLEDVIARPALKDIVTQLIRRNGVPEAGMKLILTGGYSPDAYHPVKGNFLVSQHNLVLPAAAQMNEGISVITHPYRREIPEVKTINYIMGVWLLKKMHDAHASDVLYHRDGLVSEFPRCNFFLVTRQGTLVTPANHILHGITRMRVLEIASEFCPVEVRDLRLEEVYDAAEAFLTSTTKSILPIVKVDDRPVGAGKPGPVTNALRDLLRQRERAEYQKPQLA
jgi:branched-subunit amino acid aminotransferase/4-amino-4-deoxychorismate lyase